MPRVALRTRRNLFVCPGPMGHGLSQQTVITKLITQYLLKLIEILERDGWHKNDSNKTPDTASK